MSVRARFFRHNDRDYVELTIVGDPNTIMKKVEVEHTQRFPAEWAAYEGGKGDPEPDGIPLTEIPGVTNDLAMAYKLKGVRTVEEFAALNDGALKAFGMGALTLRKAAQNLLDATRLRAMDRAIAASNAPADEPKKRTRKTEG